MTHNFLHSGLRMHKSGSRKWRLNLLHGVFITSQKTKFDYVVASLAPEFAQELKGLSCPLHRLHLMTFSRSTLYSVLNSAGYNNCLNQRNLEIENQHSCSDVCNNYWVRKPTQQTLLFLSAVLTKAANQCTYGTCLH